MVIRLRTAPERGVVPSRRPNRRLATVAAGFLGALGANGFMLCLWRWGADLDVLAGFPFSQGVFSHWQVWFGAGLMLQVFATLLSNYVRETTGTSRKIKARRLA